jgi:hypothetical protein
MARSFFLTEAYMARSVVHFLVRFTLCRADLSL